ncbi:hypothetical protein Tco_1391609 [Tanacetum coccineum]
MYDDDDRDQILSFRIAGECWKTTWGDVPVVPLDGEEGNELKIVNMESLVKKKQNGAILELKQRHLKNTIFCTYTPYPAMKIRRISVSSAQETRNDQFPIRRIHYNQYVICHHGSIFNPQGVNFSDPSFRGKTITSYIVEELTKRPQTVVFLEHIDKADARGREIGEFEILVPKVKKIKSCFDLNLPLDEAEESERGTVFDTKDVWLEEFLQQMDEKVIENEVMLQILTSCWLSDRAGGVDKWIDSVLGLMEAREKQGGVSGTMVKLAAVQRVTIEEDDALCSCLPSRIIIGLFVSRWCMTRSSAKELLSPLKNPERVLRSRRKLFNNPSLMELNPPKDDQLSEIEEHIEEEVTEIMAETME